MCLAAAMRQHADTTGTVGRTTYHHHAHKGAHTQAQAHTGAHTAEHLHKGLKGNAPRSSFVYAFTLPLNVLGFNTFKIMCSNH